MLRKGKVLAALFAVACVANQADSASALRSSTVAAAFCPSVSFGGQSKKSFVGEPRALCRHMSFQASSPSVSRTAAKLRKFPMMSKKQDGSNDETETYEMSGGGVKTLVSGLTNLVNAVMRRDDEVPEAREKRAPITVAELKDGIEDDYRRCYLWTGDIDPNLYDWDCVFTDPTLSFTGLKTFQRNLANLRPIIDAVIDDYKVDLYSVEELKDVPKIKASWRMYGRLRLPWGPAIDLKGRTVFTYEGEKGNRIVDYFESWETPAAEVLWNLLKPAQRGSE